MADYLEQSLKKLEEFEGSIPWMYRDTAGHVTVGVGLMLPDAAAAQHLAFSLDNRSATADEIAAEFARVDALPMGRPALFYRAPENAPAKPELPQAEIDSLLQTVLTGFEGELKAALPGYDSFPDSVKLALLDMAYNLGPAGLLHGYPRLIKAVETGNWTQAAANCMRVGPGAARNNWTRQMFLQNAVVSTIKAEAESAIKQVGYGLVGIAASLWHRARKK
jgi:GH24 family phage-related lysozyme (muramidase)